MAAHGLATYQPSQSVSWYLVRLAEGEDGNDCVLPVWPFEQPMGFATAAIHFQLDEIAIGLVHDECYLPVPGEVSKVFEEIRAIGRSRGVVRRTGVSNALISSG